MTLSPVLLYLEEDGICFIIDLNTGDGDIFKKSLITGHGGIQVLILYIPRAQNFFNIKYFFYNQDHFGPKKFGI